VDLKFDLRRAAREYVRRFYQIVYQKELPPFDPTSRFANNIAVFRELARNMPMEVMKSRVGNIVELAYKLWEEPRAHARAEWGVTASSLQLFCVCAERDNVLLWSNYSDCHQGVAFELDASADDAGLPLINSLPVRYSHCAPALHTRKEWIDVGLGLARMKPAEELDRQLVTTKARAWAYEKEWRVCLSGKDPRQVCTDRLFDPLIVQKILLGCRMTRQQRASILRLLPCTMFKHVEVYQAPQSQTHYALEFERVQ
jgi:hypothetical protein